MNRYLIDDDGEAWRSESKELSRQLRTHRVGPDLLDYVLRNLGFVSISSGARRVELCFDAESVRPAALIGAMYFLASHPPFSAVVCDTQSSVVQHLFSTKRALFEYLGTILEGKQSTRSFVWTEEPLGRSPFADKWTTAVEICKSVRDPAVRDRILDKLFNGMHAITKLNVASGDYEICSVGSSIHNYDDEFATFARGKSFREVYDRDYGNWTSDRFRLLANQEVPSAEKVSARIGWPNMPVQKFSYSRLLVPFREGLDDRMLLSATAKIFVSEQRRLAK